jgi:endonuclease/exonuclease/phosphatase family metal-dependent hydrolase
MIQPAAVEHVENTLATQGGTPLLAGGSAYADIFTGGAAESHFCPTARGWGPALRQAGPLVAVLLMLSHAGSVLRTMVLLCIELVLAVVDFFRGILAGHGLLKELKFVPLRVFITILLREVSVIGAKIDLARGLPIVHLNFLGYDEQAHRRGPESRFAHWTLKGIDRAVRMLWRAALSSQRRHYEVWIYSDHGQETAQPYERLHGIEFAEAVARVFSRFEAADIRYRTGDIWGEQFKRAQLFGGRWPDWLSPWASARVGKNGDPPLSVSALGPVAMIYWAPALAFEQRQLLARRLVAEARIPALLALDDASQVHAWTEDGEFLLPRDGIRLVGTAHPFQAEVIDDLISLCRHPDAGTFVACGGIAGHRTVTFANEHGSHGGCGPQETSAFALLPDDAPLPAERAGDHLRIAELRQAALRARKPHVAGAPIVTTGRQRTGIVRIMTYNVHSCIGMDGRVSPERIARIIARFEPDIVALQEIDVGRPRSGGVDQAGRIAELLEMTYYFHPAIHLEEERYGDAILTHLPLRLVKAQGLPGMRGKPQLEPRGAIWAAIDVGGTVLQIINTHLGLRRRERLAQVDALLGDAWLGHPDCDGPVILCGDLNALPLSPVCRRLRTRLRDAQQALQNHRPKATFFGRLPMVRIDYVFVGQELEVLGVEVARGARARLASDHLPLIVDLRLPGGA